MFFCKFHVYSAVGSKLFLSLPFLLLMALGLLFLKLILSVAFKPIWCLQVAVLVLFVAVSPFCVCYCLGMLVWDFFSCFLCFSLYLCLAFSPSNGWLFGLGVLVCFWHDNH